MADEDAYNPILAIGAADVRTYDDQEWSRMAGQEIARIGAKQYFERAVAVVERFLGHEFVRYHVERTRKTFMETYTTCLRYGDRADAGYNAALYLREITAKNLIKDAPEHAYRSRRRVGWRPGRPV